MSTELPAPAPAPAASRSAAVPRWAPWLLVAWALLSVLALVWMDWDAALRGVLCLPRV